ncbi:hypothetical protein [Lacunisphaera limnophila]|uniref:hypothetical protein n=1 Tax=Lacunisphaera limnophila TaxID=1838286 RepID=UPI0012FE3F06|nr:hypothetical protein [Lacunisphaera limnophila]
MDLVSMVHGGEVVPGWSLFEWPRVFIEAEHHHTWRKKSGQYEDPTPREDRKRRLLFLPDLGLKPGEYPPNRRHFLTEDSTAKEYVAVVDQLKKGGSSTTLIESMRQLRKALELKYGKEPM